MVSPIPHRRFDENDAVGTDAQKTALLRAIEVLLSPQAGSSCAGLVSLAAAATQMTALVRVTAPEIGPRCWLAVGGTAARAARLVQLARPVGFS